MDTMVLVRFEDDSKHIEVEKILWVEIPVDAEQCYVEVIGEGWGRMAKAEVWKIERYKTDIFEQGNAKTFRSRDAYRLPDAGWKKLHRWFYPRRTPDDLPHDAD